MLNQQEREILRQTIAGFLATRSAVSFSCDSIHRSITKREYVDFKIEVNDVESALVFLEGLKYAKKEPSGMGATLYWSATSEGVLASERNGWNT